MQPGKRGELWFEESYKNNIRTIQNSVETAQSKENYELVVELVSAGPESDLGNVMNESDHG